MNRHRPEPWQRFLDAERDGRSGEADHALAELLRELPRPRPAAGFAARVMARVARRSVFARPAVRFGLAAALVAVALTAGLALPAIGPLAGLIGPAGVLHLLVDSATDLTIRVGHGLEIWQTLAAAARSVGAVALHPPVLFLLVLQLAIAAAALYALAGLAVPKRSSSHASL